MKDWSVSNAVPGPAPAPAPADAARLQGRSAGLFREALVAAAAYLLLYAAAMGSLWWDGTVLIGSDLKEAYYPNFHSDDSLWSRWLMTGFPVYASPPEQTFYPLKWLFKALDAWNAYLMIPFVIGSTGVYVYTRRLTGSRSGAALAGVIFGLSEAGFFRYVHVNIHHGLAWVPWFLIAVEQLAATRRLLWAAVAATLVALIFLAGHPQVLVYCAYFLGAYAVVLGCREGRSLAYWGGLGVAAVGAVLLMAVQVVPMVQLMSFMERSTYSFEQFAEMGLTVAELPAALVPAIFHSDLTAAIYLSWGGLVLAVIGATRARRDWRAVYWLVVSVLAVVAALGRPLPVADILYHLPLLDKFRAIGRLLWFYGLGMSVLAGYGVALVAAQAVSLRRVATITAATLAATLLLIAVLIWWPTLYPLPYSNPPISLSSVSLYLTPVVSMVVAVVSAALIFLLAKRPGSRAIAMALAAIVVCDLMVRIGITPTGLHGRRLPEAQTDISVHGAELRERLTETGQRVLPLVGQESPLLYPNGTRQWKVESSSGVMTMSMQNYVDVLRIDHTGWLREDILTHHMAGLDITGTRYVVVPAKIMQPGGRFESHGMTWASQDLRRYIGPGCSVPEHPSSVRLSLAKPLQVAEIGLVGRVGCMAPTETGMTIAEIVLHRSDGSVTSLPLRAGLEMADEAAVKPERQEAVGHGPAPIFGYDGDRPLFLGRLSADPSAAAVEGLEILWHGNGGRLTLQHLTVRDDQGVDHPVEGIAPALHDRSTWREIMTVRTSRETDRGADQEARGEEDVIVYENLRAMPRAWFVENVVALETSKIPEAFSSRRLSDGTHFDPATTAVVDAPAAVPVAAAPLSGDERIDIVGRSETSVTLRASTAVARFLVLGEAWYPGWRVAIDGQRAPLYRTNHIQRGVVVPAGEHIVEFSFVPEDLLIGGGITALGGFGLLGLVMLDERRRRRRVQLGD